jgi:hypothetical protein
LPIRDRVQRGAFEGFSATLTDLWPDSYAAERDRWESIRAELNQYDELMPRTGTTATTLSMLSDDEVLQIAARMVGLETDLVEKSLPGHE